MILEDTNTINAILNQLVDERMVEPIDDPSNLTDFWDWAEVVGIVDEFEPKEMVDENGEVWYVS